MSMGKHLKTKPHKTANENFWWYEENCGIVTCTRTRDSNNLDRTIVNVIPWRAVRAALYRKDKQ